MIKQEMFLNYNFTNINNRFFPFTRRYPDRNGFNRESSAILSSCETFKQDKSDDMRWIITTKKVSCKTKRNVISPKM
jgi:hypothetical protein